MSFFVIARQSQKGEIVFLTCSPPQGGQRAGGQKQSGIPAARSPSAGQLLVVIHGRLNMDLWSEGKTI